VTLRTGGITMGIMTLALSLFSVIPMALLLANRVFWARVITHLVILDMEKNSAPPFTYEVFFCILGQMTLNHGK
jgi:hypothetical protein